MDDLQQRLNAAVIARVLSICDKKGWSARRLATQAGMSSRTAFRLLQKTENQKDYISLTTILKIANAFEMELSQFFDDPVFKDLKD